MAIAESRQAVLVPPVGPGPRMVMGKVLPGSPAGAVVFAHTAPGALTEVRTPALPMLCSLTGFLEPDTFSREGSRVRGGCRLRLASFRHSGAPFTGTREARRNRGRTARRTEPQVADTPLLEYRCPPDTPRRSPGDAVPSL